MAKLKIVQVGVGGFGKRWINAVKNAPEWEIAGIVDVNRENLLNAAKEYGLPEEKCFTAVEECFERKISADAVLNVTPPQVHKEVSVTAMEAGLDVLVEKPLSDSMEDAEIMLKSAEKNRRKLMVSQSARYKSQPRTVRKLIEENIAGRISYVVIDFQKGPQFPGFRTEMEYPLLIDMAIHHFDLMRYITGQDSLKVYAESFNPGWSWFKGDAVLNLFLELTEDIHIVYSGSWVSRGKDTTWAGDWEIYGEKGTLFWKDEKIWFLGGGEQREITPLPLEREDQSFSLYEFYRAITEDREPETGVKDNMKSLAMVFKSLESVKNRRPVAF